MSIGLLVSINLFANFAGDGVEAYQKGNITLASELYTKDCKNGNMHACINLGILYATGNGVEQDNIKAKKLFVKACKKRYSKACFQLGVLYKQGRDGITQDKRRAKMFFAKSCDIGYERSCEQYDIMNEKGI